MFGIQQRKPVTKRYAKTLMSFGFMAIALIVDATRDIAGRRLAEAFIALQICEFVNEKSLIIDFARVLPQ